MLKKREGRALVWVVVGWGLRVYVAEVRGQDVSAGLLDV